MYSRFTFLVVLGFAFPATAASALTSGCGPSVSTTAQGGGGAGGLDAGGDAGATTTTWWTSTDGGHDALPDYTDPGCPDAAPPEQMYECDPYNQGNGDCEPEEGCYIFVQYPEEPCGQETYGAFCMLAGFGGQGAGCSGGQDCQAGFVCVVSGSGNQCVELCHIVGISGCPDGLVCEPIDVEGFGGCL